MSSADDSSPAPSRSASRRRRRQKPSRSQKPMPSLSENENEGKEMVKGFDRIGGPEESMNGPVSKSRVERGEIPAERGQSRSESMVRREEKGKGGDGDMMQKDGLKLRVELNLDVEIELKASIRGDLTVALLN